MHSGVSTGSDCGQFEASFFIGLHPSKEPRWVFLAIFPVVSLRVGVVGIDCNSRRRRFAVGLEYLPADDQPLAKFPSLYDFGAGADTGGRRIPDHYQPVASGIAPDLRGKRIERIIACQPARSRYQATQGSSYVLQELPAAEVSHTLSLHR